MRILVICDDRWHPARTIQEGLSTLQAKDIAFDWITHATDWSATRMAGYPAVLLAKSDNVSATDERPWVDESVQAAFVDYVRQGGGLLAVHSGTVYAHRPTMRALLGGVFVRHPPQCPVTVEPKSGHPLTVGVTALTLPDEHYMIELADPQVDLFLATRSEHGTQPGGWTRSEGAGRVCVLTPGHTVEVWQHPVFQTLLINCLRWCSPKVSIHPPAGLDTHRGS